MATITDLGKQVKAKYPGQYDDLSDDQVGLKVQAKYPGAYDDFSATTKAEVKKPSNYWNNQENGILPYGAINEGLAPTPNPTGIKAPGIVAKNYGKSAIKAGAGVLGFLDPISNVKKIIEGGKAAYGYGADVAAAKQSENQLAQMERQRGMQPTKSSFNPLTALLGQVPGAVYQQLAPPAIQQGIQQGMDAKKSGYSTSGSIIEGLAGGLQSSAEDPGQWLPAFMMGNRALGNTKVGKAVNKGVTTISKPIQSVVDAGVRKSTPALFSKSAEQMRMEKMQSGLQNQNIHQSSVNKSFQKNTKGDVTPADTFTKYKISPKVKEGKLQMGDYKAGEGTLGEIRGHVSALDAKIESALKSKGRTVNVQDLRNQAIAEAKANPTLRQSGTVQSTVNQINSRFDDYTASYGKTMKIGDVNEIRKTVNQDWKIETQDTSRIIGDATRKIVYKSEPSVQGLLREQGNLLAARKYAESLNGKAVKGGRLGNYFGSAAGAVAGLGIPIPFLGPIIGAVAGNAAASGLQQAQFNSPLAGLKGSKVGRGGSYLSKAVRRQLQFGGR